MQSLRTSGGEATPPVPVVLISAVPVFPLFYLQAGVSGAIAALGVLLSYLYVGRKPTSVEFLIATDGEIYARSTGPPASRHIHGLDLGRHRRLHPDRGNSVRHRLRFFRVLPEDQYSPDQVNPVRARERASVPRPPARHGHRWGPPLPAFIHAGPSAQRLSFCSNLSSTPLPHRISEHRTPSQGTTLPR